MRYVIEHLKNKSTFSFRPNGNSMQPIIKSGQLCTIKAIRDYDQPLKIDDIVFCKVKGNFYLHKISGIKTKESTTLYQISNNKGYVNGWTNYDKIYGILISIE